MPWWPAVWGWCQKVPGWIWFALGVIAAALLGVYIVDRNARKDERHKIESDELREEIALNNTAKEQIDAIEDRLVAANDAVARLPQFSSADELRQRDPALAAIILRDPGRHDD